eukprot:CAMPEP_0180084766 /NCGR_PEP_ID=MMETSP0985-20121206/20060_1 /TAXON_ID=483367 /ORGANISM="non described non described, Strain CCMP 2436" /LENGTH=119 /DNA_ID=CAMNT_0022018497 /DNA_START=163 /DNA_END=521 /DNA_ORIENTATION=-
MARALVSKLSRATTAPYMIAHWRSPPAAASLPACAFVAASRLASAAAVELAAEQLCRECEAVLRLVEVRVAVALAPLAAAVRRCAAAAVAPPLLQLLPSPPLLCAAALASDGGTSAQAK